ncbi:MULTISPECIES: hypothetical protein [Sporosarcina]|uniref:Uncharacterized protein n=1 Tax=Sporosarcina saromensis TaxID=359365 RepID=A0ABU4GCT7_9BACL|nr:hypothetical protein [Sporosarcina saromensis]MDW0114777.1 hypothetical protein [Sporosarcina saromensis]
MELIHWEYGRKYQVKGIFNEFPSTVVIFRQIKDYYFIYTMSAIDDTSLPTRKQYVQMEYLLNKELGTLPAYRNRQVFRTSLQNQTDFHIEKKNAQIHIDDTPL